MHTNITWLQQEPTGMFICLHWSACVCSHSKQNSLRYLPMHASLQLHTLVEDTDSNQGLPGVQRELWWLLVVWLSFSLVAEHCWLRSGILSLSHGKCSLILSFSLFLSAFWLFKLYYSTVESFGTVKHYKFIHVQGTVCSMPHIELQRKPMGNTLASWQWCLYCHYTQWNLYIDNGLSHCDVSDLWNLSSKKPDTTFL